MTMLVIVFSRQLWDAMSDCMLTMSNNRSQSVMVIVWLSRLSPTHAAEEF